MKNLLKSTFAFVILIFTLIQTQNLTAQTLAPFPAKYSFVNESEMGEFQKRSTVINEVVVPSGDHEYASAHFLPIPFDNVSSSMKVLGLGKNHLLMITLCLSAFFLVLSHKNRFETDIYEFYNRSSSGEILFESPEIAKTHENKSFLALSLKILGLTSGLIGILILVF